jgi:hypothetical protein
VRAFEVVFFFPAGAHVGGGCVGLVRGWFVDLVGGWFVDLVGGWFVDLDKVCGFEVLCCWGTSFVMVFGWKDGDGEEGCGLRWFI